MAKGKPIPALVALDQLRHERGYSCKQIGELVDKSAGAVAAWGRGDRTPGVDLVAAYAEVFPGWELKLVNKVTGEIRG